MINTRIKMETARKSGVLVFTNQAQHHIPSQVLGREGNYRLFCPEMERLPASSSFSEFIWQGYCVYFKVKNFPLFLHIFKKDAQRLLNQ